MSCEREEGVVVKGRGGGAGWLLCTKLATDPYFIVSFLFWCLVGWFFVSPAAGLFFFVVA